MAEDLLVNIEVNSKPAQKGVDDLTDSLDSNTRQTKELAKVQKDLEKTFKDLAKVTKQANDTVSKMSKTLDTSTIKVKALGTELSKNKTKFKQANKSIGETTKSLNEFTKQADLNAGQFSQSGEKIRTIFDDIAEAAAIAGATIGTVFVGVAANKIPAVKKSLAPLVATFLAVGKKAELVGKIIKGSFSASLLSAVEAASFLGPALIGIGGFLKDSENAIISFIGSVVQLIGILATGLVGALSVALTALGGFIQGIGEDLITSTEEAEKAFQKLQVTMVKFTFAIENFGKVLGRDAIGGLKEWNKFLDETDRSTTFTRESIAKSIKLMVVEGAALGLTAKENQKILQTAADIAALTGEDLLDVSKKIVSAFNGQAVALANLGINLTKTGLAHSKLAKDSGLLLNQMNEQEILQLRINELLDKGRAFAGAAADEINTITGAQTILNKVQEQNLAILGEQNEATRQYLVFQIKLAQFFNELPPSVLRTIGTIKDLLGVTLTIMGATIKYTFAILGMVLAFNVLAATMFNVFGITLKLSGIFGFVLKRLLPLVIGLQLFATAFKELEAAGGPFTKFLDALLGTEKQVQEETEETVSIFTKLGSVLRGTFRVAVEITKLALIGFAEAIVLAQLGIANLVRAFTTDSGKLKVLDKQIKNIERGLDELIGEATKSQVAIASFGEETATASEEVLELQKKLAKTTKEFKRFRADVEQMAKTINKSFDASAERVKIFGNEFEQAGVAVSEARRKIDEVFDVKSTREDTAKRLAEAQRNLVIEELNLEKLKVDKIKEFNQLAKTAELDRLRAQGKTVQALRLELKERLSNFDAQVKALKNVTKLSAEQLSIIRESRKTLEEAGLAEIFKEQARQLEEGQKEAVAGLERLQSATSRLGDISRIFGASEKTRIKEATKSRLLEVKNLELQLRAAKALTSSRENALKQIRERINLEEKLQLIALDEREANKAREAALKNFEDLQGMLKSINRFVERRTLSERELANLQMERALAQVTAVEEELKANKALTPFREDQIEQLKEAIVLRNELKGGAPITLGDIGSGILSSLKKAKSLLDGLQLSEGFRLPNLGKMFKEAGDATVNFLKDAGKAAVDILSNISLSDIADVGAMIGEGMLTAARGFIAFFDPSNLDRMAKAITDTLLKLPKLIEKAFAKLDQALKNLIEALPEIAKSLIDAFPAIAQALADAAPELARAIMQAFAAILQSLPQILAPLIDALSEVIGELLRGLPDAIMALFQAIPQIVAMMLAEIPQIMVEILNALPDIIEQVLFGVIGAMGEIVGAFVDFLIGGGLEKIVVALIKAMPRIALALVKGFVNGVRRALTGIFGAVSFPQDKIAELAGQVSEGFKAAFAQLTGETSQLFAVKDFADPAAGLDPAKQTKALADAVLKNFKIGGDLLGKLFRFLKKIWDGVIKFFKKFGKLISDAWKKIIKFFENLGQVILTAFQEILMFFARLGEIVLGAFQAVFDWFQDTFGTLIADGWNGIIRFFQVDLFNAVNNAWMSIVNFFKNDLLGIIMDAFAQPIAMFNTLKEIVTDAFLVPINFFKNLLKGDIDGAFAGVFDFFRNSLTKIIDTAIIQPIKGLADTFSGFGTKISDGLKTALSGITSVFTGIGGSIFDGLKKMLTDPGAGLKQIMTGVLDALNPASIAKKIFDFGDIGDKGDVESILGINIPFVKFAEGGMVPGMSPVPGDSFINDRIIAALSPGEAVIPRSLMDDPFVRKLVDKILSGDFSPLNLATGDVLSTLSGGTISDGDLSGLDPTQIDFSQLDPSNIDFSQLSADNLEKVALKATVDAFNGLKAGADALKKMLEDIGLIPALEQMKDRLMREVAKMFNKMLGAAAANFPKAVEGNLPLPAVRELIADAVAPVGTAAINLEGTLAPVDPSILEGFSDLSTVQLSPDAIAQLDASQSVIVEAQRGGLVGGFSAGDGTRALLQPGEFVVNRSGVQQLGLDVLGAANKGQATGGGGDTNINIDMNIETTEAVDEDFVRLKLIPAVKDEFKEASLRGDFLISKRGLRE